MRGLWCVALLALGATHGQDRQPGQGVNFFSKDKEIALGQQLALEVRKKTTPLDNADVTDHVKRAGANLAAQMPGGWTYQIETVRESLGGSTCEPVSLPGGFVFVSQDLIAAAQNEAEFAGMLAHAMAHIAERHWTREATKGQMAQIGMQISMMSAGNAGTGQAVPLSLLTMRRANEREADYLAVQAMAVAGYDPAGLASYVGRLQAPPGPGSVAHVFDPLPTRDERVRAINVEIGRLPQRNYTSSEEFARIQAEVKVPAADPAPSLIRKMR